MLYQTSWGRYVSGRAVWLLVASQLIVKLILKGQCSGRTTTQCCYKNAVTIFFLNIYFTSFYPIFIVFQLILCTMFITENTFSVICDYSHNNRLISPLTVTKKQFFKFKPETNLSSSDELCYFFNFIFDSFLSEVDMKPPCLCSALPIKSDLWVGYKLGQRSFFCQLGVKCQTDDGQKFLESFHRSDPVSGSTAEVTGQGVFLNQKKGNCSVSVSLLQTDAVCSNFYADERD